jgi:hypothetical protein
MFPTAKDDAAVRLAERTCTHPYDCARSRKHVEHVQSKVSDASRKKDFAQCGPGKGQAFKLGNGFFESSRPRLFFVEAVPAWKELSERGDINGRDFMPQLSEGPAFETPKDIRVTPLDARSTGTYLTADELSR